MAIGTKADFKIYDEQFNSGVVEMVAQNYGVFNNASQGSIRLIDRRLGGEYNKTAFFKLPGSVSRRDPTSTSDATAIKLSQEEQIGVKINRKVGPIDHNLDAFKKALLDEAEGDDRVMSQILGRAVGEEMLTDQVNTTLLSIATALNGQTDVKFDRTAGTMRSEDLIDGLAKMGDAQAQVVVWVMHSKVWFNLMKEQLSQKITGVSNFNLFEGSPVTLNRPVLVVDSPGLFLANGSATDTYLTLGLQRDAVACINSESQSMISEIVTGKENLVCRLQGEFAYNMECKGFAYDVANGAANPTDATLGTTTNWDKVATSYKHLGGIVIESQ